jgi:hypothetical protein
MVACLAAAPYDDIGIGTRGDIVGWLNSDDMYAPGALSRALAEFQRDPTVDVIYGQGGHASCFVARRVARLEVDSQPARTYPSKLTFRSTMYIGRCFTSS